MKCNACGVYAYIDSTEVVFEGDESPDTETKAYYNQHFVCRNPACPNNGKEIGTLLIPIK